MARWSHPFASVRLRLNLTNSHYQESKSDDRIDEFQSDGLQAEGIHRFRHNSSKSSWRALGIREQSRIASAAYSRFAYGINQPIIHTHPDLTQEMSHAEVHSIDYGHVANSTILVLLGEHPSFGAGKELAWANTYQLTVVIVAPRNSNIPLTHGLTWPRSEPIRFDGHEQLAALLDQVARQGLARAKTHMENRFDREKRFLKVWFDLRRRVLSTHPLSLTHFGN